MAENNVVDLDCETLLDIPAEKMLDAAKDAKLKHVIIIGEDEDGEEYFTSSTSDLALINWLLDRTKQAVLYMADEDDDDEDNI